MTGRSARPPGIRRAVIAAAALACAVIVSVAPTANDRAAAFAPPDKRVMLITDSVGLGTRGILPTHFPGDWDVSIVGKPAVFVSDLPGGYIAPNLFRAGDHVVIAAGYNYPFWDPVRFDRAIDSTVQTLTRAGVKHVYWVTLREVKPQYISASGWRQIQPYYWYFPTVNQHLERAVERHPALTLIDWAAVADRPGITYDAIHLNRTGADLYSSLIARAVSDSRTRPPNESVTRVKVADPADVAAGDVTAVAVNLTSVRGRMRGYLSAFPCETGPGPTSNLNHQRDETVAAAAIVPVDAAGEICVFNSQAGQLIVDVFGRFSADAALVDSGPRRLLDTRRPAGSVRHPALTELRVDVGTPDLTVAMSVTVTQAVDRGYLTVYDCGTEPPNTSNVSFTTQLAVPNLVVARTDASGHVCLIANRDAHVIVDLLAEFGPATTVRTTRPERLVDTRGGQPPTAGQVIRITVPPDSGDGADPSSLTAPSGVIGNLTIVRAGRSGFATVYPCSESRPTTSNINYRSGMTLANAVIAEPDVEGMLCVYTSQPAEVVFDLLGTTGDGFDGIIPFRYLDTRTR